MTTIESSYDYYLVVYPVSSNQATVFTSEPSPARASTKRPSVHGGMASDVLQEWRSVTCQECGGSAFGSRDWTSPFSLYPLLAEVPNWVVDISLGAR